MTLLHAERLKNVSDLLIELIVEIGKDYDVIVVCGHRGKEEQNAAYNRGLSEVKWPNSHHNSLPSLAIDVAPIDIKTNKIIWDNKQCWELRKLIEKKAKELNIELKAAITWDFLHIALKH